MKTYPTKMKDLPEFRQFCDDMRRAGHTVGVDKGFPFVHVVDPDYIRTLTTVETDSFEEVSNPGTHCLFPLEPNGAELAH